jgi:hypothetical protein
MELIGTAFDYVQNALRGDDKTEDVQNVEEVSTEESTE